MAGGEEDGYQATDEAGEGAERAGRESTLGERRLRMGELPMYERSTEDSRVVEARSGEDERFIANAKDDFLRIRRGR